MNEYAHTRTTFLAILFLGVFAMAARNVIDPDVWWHLRTGQLIVQQGKVPHTDPFSYTSTGKPWIAHEWLTDVLLYEVHRGAGWGGLIVVFAAMICLAFYVLCLRCGANPYFAGVATLCAAFATRPVWGVRPQILSFALTSIWLLLLERSRQNPHLLWWTLPLTLLWVNLHAGFALGLVIYVLLLLGDWIENKSVENNLSVEPKPAPLGTASLILILDLLIVPINPNGFKLFWYPVQTLRSAAMQDYIVEWASPNFHYAEYWPFLLIVLALCAMLIWSRMAVRPADLLLLLVSLFAALRSIRLIPFFVLIAVPLLSRQISKPRSVWPLTLSPRRDLPPLTRYFLNGTIIAAVTAFCVVHTGTIIHRQPEVEVQHFPVRATAFLLAHPPAGHLLNDYDWGGYLIWKLYPSLHVFVDGRADVYGDAFLHQFADTYQFKNDWNKALQPWDVQTVLIPLNSALATGLRSAPGWSVVYEDAQSVLLSRSISGPARAAQRGSPTQPKPYPSGVADLCTTVTLGMQEITPSGCFCRL